MSIQEEKLQSKTRYFPYDFPSPKRSESSGAKWVSLQKKKPSSSSIAAPVSAGCLNYRCRLPRHCCLSTPPAQTSPPDSCSPLYSARPRRSCCWARAGGCSGKPLRVWVAVSTLLLPFCECRDSVPHPSGGGCRGPESHPAAPRPAGQRKAALRNGQPVPAALLFRAVCPRCQRCPGRGCAEALGTGRSRPGGGCCSPRPVLKPLAEWPRSARPRRRAASGSAADPRNIAGRGARGRAPFPASAPKGYPRGAEGSLWLTAETRCVQAPAESKAVTNPRLPLVLTPQPLLLSEGCTSCTEPKELNWHRTTFSQVVLLV